MTIREEEAAAMYLITLSMDVPIELFRSQLEGLNRLIVKKNLNFSKNVNDGDNLDYKKNPDFR